MLLTALMIYVAIGAVYTFYNDTFWGPGEFLIETVIWPGLMLAEWTEDGGPDTLYDLYGKWVDEREEAKNTEAEDLKKNPLD